jgi:hypothetical protein
MNHCHCPCGNHHPQAKHHLIPRHDDDHDDDQVTKYKRGVKKQALWCSIPSISGPPSGVGDSQNLIIWKFPNTAVLNAKPESQFWENGG